jgi:hypothetical protein
MHLSMHPFPYLATCGNMPMEGKRCNWNVTNKSGAEKDEDAKALIGVFGTCMRSWGGGGGGSAGC